MQTLRPTQIRGLQHKKISIFKGLEFKPRSLWKAVFLWETDRQTPVTCAAESTLSL